MNQNEAQKQQIPEGDFLIDMVIRCPKGTTTLTLTRAGYGVYRKYSVALLIQHFMEYHREEYEAYKGHDKPGLNALLEALPHEKVFENQRPRSKP